jgi:hypothetical protein
MASYTFGSKEYEFNRATPVRIAVVEGLVNESELTVPSLTVADFYQKDKERFAKLSDYWKQICNAMFKEGFNEDLTLENLVYPDEVREIVESFFSSSWERTMKGLKERVETLAKTSTKSR